MCLCSWITRLCQWCFSHPEPGGDTSEVSASGSKDKGGKSRKKPAVNKSSVSRSQGGAKSTKSTKGEKKRDKDGNRNTKGKKERTEDDGMESEHSNKRCALITGITGQDGSFLSEKLLDKGYIVYGLVRRSSLINTHRIDHIYDNPNLRLRYGDMTDFAGIMSVLTEIREQHFDRLEIYNLAAMSQVHVSFQIPVYTAQVDGVGTLNLLESVRHLDMASYTRIYQASTSELYGKVLEKPQTETTPFNPRSPYAVAKLFAYWITKNYREAHDIWAVNGILFNHESDRRGETFVTRKITIALGRILMGEQDVLELGNLDAVRDWLHARDCVDAMWLMLQQDEPEDFVIASGVTHSVREFVELAFAERGIHIRWEGEGLDEVGWGTIPFVDDCERPLVKVNAKYFRATEVDYLHGNATKARRLLGWVPEISFTDLVKEMVDHDAGHIMVDESKCK